MKYHGLLLCLTLFTGGHALWLTVERKTESSFDSSAVKVKNSMFDLAACLGNQGNLKKLATEGRSICQHPFSCNNFWTLEVATEVASGSFCYYNAYERNVPADTRKTLDDAYDNYLKEVVSPQWEILMQTVSMTGNGGSAAVQLDCNSENSNGDKLKCMMSQTKSLFQKHGGHPHFDKLSMSDEQAAQLREKLQRLHSGLALVDTTVQAKVDALEMGGGGGDVEDMILGPEDDIPIPGPLKNSLINPPSPTRYSHSQPGLKMKGRKLTDLDPRALCNDGTSGIYYMAEASKTKFHLHLGGGYFCYNGRNCRKRARKASPLVSSAGHEIEHRPWRT